MNKYGLAVIALILSGCAVKPEVTYKIIDAQTPSPDTTLTDSFFLTSSVIELNPTTEKIIRPNGKKTTAEKYTINVTQGDYPDLKIGIISDDGFWEKTKVSISKIENSDRVKEIGVDTTDNRVQAIKDISAIAIAIIPFTAALSDDLKTAPVTNKFIISDIIRSSSSDIIFDIDNNAPSNLKEKNDNLLTAKIKIDDKTSARIFLSSQPLNSIKMDDFKKQEIREKLKNAFIYSACTDAKIEVSTNLNDGTVATQTFQTRISDPRYIQYVALPYKGKITTHSQCGVSVETDTSSSSSDAAIATTILTELNNIKTEIDKDKNKKKS
jgi:hypothetical protein